MERSEIRYAITGEHHIAYRELVGDSSGSHDVVMVTGANFPMDSLEGDPLANRMVEGLASLGRLVMFDRRGIGLSDPIVDWDAGLREQYEDDLLAVMDAAGLESPTIFCFNGMGVAPGFAIRWPDRVGRLVLWNPAAPIGPEDEVWVAEYVAKVKDVLDGPAFNPLMWPNRWHDPAFRAWHDAAGRAGASPTSAARQLDAINTQLPIDPSRVVAPTLVITRWPPVMPWSIPEEYTIRAARLIPNATLVQLPAGDQWPFGVGVDDVLEEISRFVTGRVQLPDPDRYLSAILFTDLIDSTRRATAEGDAQWKELLDRHDQIGRDVVHRCGGEVIKATGDGVLALLPSATAALDAARGIRSQLADADLPVRIGIHVGEIDRRGDDVSGIAVNIAARIMSEAAAGQILVSEFTKQLARSAPLERIGERTLKGIDELWRLYEVADT